ncbi:MAG: hypothetical protein KDC53_03690 [Saprospiraceae bacterium]|nr:hypothetical protein [Saprospiraceae bacterium]
MLITFWLIVFSLTIIWYLVVTILVAWKGFGSLRTMLNEFKNNEQE